MFLNSLFSRIAVVVGGYPTFRGSSRDHLEDSSVSRAPVNHRFYQAAEPKALVTKPALSRGRSCVTDEAVDSSVRSSKCRT